MQSVDVCAWLTCSVVFAALGWFSKKAQPGQLFCGLVRGALVGCVVPRAALTRGGKSKKRPAAMDPWQTTGQTGCWVVGWWADNQVTPRGPCKTAGPSEALGVVWRLPPGRRFSFVLGRAVNKWGPLRPLAN